MQESVSKAAGTVSNFNFLDAIYEQDKWIGESILHYAYQGKLRGLPVSNFRFNPVKYNPAENKLVIYHHVKATLTLPEPERISEDLSNLSVTSSIDKICSKSLILFTGILIKIYLH